MKDTFDHRLQVFEKQFEHDQELWFRILSRRTRLLAEWAAQHLGLTGDDVTNYTHRILDLVLKDSEGDQSLITYLKKDFDDHGLDISLHRIEKEAERLLPIATEQIYKE